HGDGFWPALPVSREVIELEANLPYRCKVHFSDPSELHCFQLFRCIQHGASQSELLDPGLAPQVHRKRRDTSQGTDWFPSGDALPSSDTPVSPTRSPLRLAGLTCLM
uniref:Uncharacterized protein n=1 Tax=Bos indicus x Bos taurus TaxID=30522 RepID=A0A4W2CB03_BOBOX